MAKLCDLVEILENNMECVVLRVKEGVQMQLICLGCFDGDETMVRVTKGDSHVCTLFRDRREPFSWNLGKQGHGPVNGPPCERGRMIETCISEDFGIYMGKDAAKRKATLHVRSLGDMKGCVEHYKLQWWECGSDYVNIHKDGEYHTRIAGLKEAEEYVRGKIDIGYMSGVYRSPQTGCCIRDMEGRRK